MQATSTGAENPATPEPVEHEDFSGAQYTAAFGWNSKYPAKSKKYESTSRLAKAYEVALDIRKFEIELYWKRSTNFWLFVAAIAAALAAVASTSTPTAQTPLLDARQKETVCLILSLAGALLCAGWMKINEAGKLWQRNWENHVDLLEQELVGPLYKTVLLKKGSFETKPHFSASDLNKSVSKYLFIMFCLSALYWTGIAALLAPHIQQRYGILPGDFAQWSTYAVRLILVLFHAGFALLVYRQIMVKTGSDKNELDIELEGTSRAVRLKTLHASTSGKKNLTPASRPKAPLRFPDRANCGPEQP